MNELNLLPQVNTERKLDWEVVPYVDMVMALGKANGWRFWNAGPGKMITSPVFCDNDWKLVPLEQDPEVIIPLAGIQRLNTIMEAGIPIDGIVVAHEPKPAPNEEPRTRTIEVPQINWGFVLRGVGVGLLGILAVASLPVVIGVVALALAVIAAGALVVAGLGAVAAVVVAGIDPALIVVVEDTYIIVYAWLDDRQTG